MVTAGIILVVGIFSVVIGGHFGGGDHFDGGDHFGGVTSNRNVKRRIDLLKQKHYLCACLVSISYTGFKQASSCQLFKKNLPSSMFHCYHLPLFCQIVRIVVLRVKTYKKIQTNN